MISFRQSDLLQTLKNRRDTFLITLMVYESDKGDDSIDFLLKNKDGSYFTGSNLVRNALGDIRNEYNRSFDCFNVDSIDLGDKKYSFKRKIRDSLYLHTSYDIAAKLKAALPYYFIGITNDEDINVNDSENCFTPIAFYIPKHSNGEDVVLNIGGKSIKGTIFGTGGDGIYAIRTPDGEFSIKENEI